MSLSDALTQGLDSTTRDDVRTLQTLQGTARHVQFARLSHQRGWTRRLAETVQAILADGTADDDIPF